MLSECKDAEASMALVKGAGYSFTPEEIKNVAGELACLAPERTSNKPSPVSYTITCASHRLPGPVPAGAAGLCSLPVS